MKKFFLTTLAILIMLSFPLTVQANNQENDGKFIHTLSEPHRICHVAKLYSLDAELVAAMNNIDAQKILPVGTKIEIPQEPQQKVHIQSGDTLWDIAKANNLNLQTIMQENHINNPRSLKVGQEIILPIQNSEKAIIQQKTTTIKTASRAHNSNFIWPLSGPITSYFGPRGNGYHHGIDIAADSGTDINAIQNGTVVKAGWLSGIYGYGVKIEHENGFCSLYAHAQKVLVKEGDLVTSGNAIAEVGSTGHSTGPHLHLEIRLNDTAQNPLNYLP